ncbi:MAG: HU family DNA-binding protein [Desulfovibrio sp.]|jgi:DNA-binding protein HU-beta|nr:HU family DNA-binding protein [Desulfovibrio sp.]
MTRNDLMRKLHEATHLSLAQSLELLNKLGSIIAAELLQGGEVSIPEVGKLVVKETPARKGRNPTTGEAIDIPAGQKVVLRMSRDLKNALRG